MRITIPALLALAAAIAVTAAQAAPQQRFTLTGTTIHGKDSPIRVTSAGPISGTGTAVDRDSKTKDELTIRFRKGTLRITSKEGPVTAKPNYRTCTAALTAHGTFLIVGGSGAYASASGSGTYVRHDRLVGGRTPSGKCAGRNATPAAVYDHVTMTGTSSLG